MSWPSPLYVTTNSERVITITGAKYRATVDETSIMMGEPYQDDPAQLAASGSVLTLADTTTTGSGMSVYAGHAQAINNGGTPSSTPAAYASDKITHTLRQRTMSKSKYVWYDSPTIVLTCTTVSASNSLVVPTGATFIVGMGVSGTGIPVGAVIVAVTDATHVLLSQPMTASASVVVTFTGNSVGDCWVVDYADSSGSMPVYLS